MLARPWYFGGFCRFRLFLSHWCLFKSSFLSSLWFKLLMWCCKNDWQQSPACDWAIRCTNENWRLTQVCQVGQTLHPGYFGFILVHLVDATSIFIFVIMTTFRLHTYTQHLFANSFDSCEIPQSMQMWRQHSDICRSLTLPSHALQCIIHDCVCVRGVGVCFQLWRSSCVLGKLLLRRACSLCR